MTYTIKPVRSRIYPKSGWVVMCRNLDIAFFREKEDAEMFVSIKNMRAVDNAVQTAVDTTLESWYANYAS